MAGYMLFYSLGSASGSIGSTKDVDFYRVYISTNGSTWETYATILAFEGTVNGDVGLELLATA